MVLSEWPIRRKAIAAGHVGQVVRIRRIRRVGCIGRIGRVVHVGIGPPAHIAGLLGSHAYFKRPMEGKDEF